MVSERGRIKGQMELVSGYWEQRERREREGERESEKKWEEGRERGESPCIVSLL